MNDLVLFESSDGAVTMQVQTDRETVWLNRAQLAELFGRDVKTIGKHIANALREELDDSVVAKYATTAADGKNYQVEYYNLDMVISDILTYDECREVIDSMRFSETSDLFGKEKDDLFRGSIGNIYQSFGGQDIYPTTAR